MELSKYRPYNLNHYFLKIMKSNLRTEKNRKAGKWSLKQHRMEWERKRRIQFSTSTRFSFVLAALARFLCHGLGRASAFPWNNCHRPREQSAFRKAVQFQREYLNPLGTNKTRKESSIENCRVAVKAPNTVALQHCGVECSFYSRNRTRQTRRVPPESKLRIIFTSSIKLFCTNIISQSFIYLFVNVVNLITLCCK